jgi:hypothetical protein
MDDATARKLVMSPAGSKSPSDLFRLAGALDPAGQETPEGVRIHWLAEILQVGNPRVWRCALDGTAAVSERPFVPLSINYRDGLRSFDIDDLPAEAEAPLRALAASTQNDVVAARLFHVLWCRFRSDPNDSARAIDAYLRVAINLNGPGEWPYMEHLLGHASVLVYERKDKNRLENLQKAFDDCASRILAGTRPSGFAHLADGLLGSLLASSWAAKLVPEEQKDRWIVTLAMLATFLNSVGQADLANDTLAILEAWYRRAGKPEASVRVRRWRVEQAIETASNESPTLRAVKLERALEMAGNYGLPDLVERCRALLRPAIVESSQHMTTVSTRLAIPAEYLRIVDEIIAREPTWHGAIRQLALVPLITTAPIAAFESGAEETLSSSPLWAFLRTGQYRDGKPAFDSDNAEGKLKENVALSASIHLSIVEVLLRHFLQSTRNRWTPTGLFEALSDWPLLDDKHRPFLRTASERFASQDWISAGMTLLPRYEAVLRDLLRAGGYHALKAADGRPGVLMDETLSSLVTSRRVTDMLGNDYTWWVRFVMCDPELAPNLRNEAAHGTLEASDLTPARLLLVWLFFVRLTFYVPSR